MKHKKHPRSLIVTSTSDTPIFITYRWSANPLGGPADIQAHACVAKGDSIDLSALGFVRGRPKKARTKK